VHSTKLSAGPWLAWLIAATGGCAPDFFVPRPPGVEVMRPGLSVNLKERQGDPVRGEGARYGVDIQSPDEWKVVRASIATSEAPCGVNVDALTVDAQPQRGFSTAHGGPARTSSGVTVPGGADARALDLTISNSAEVTTCVRLPVEGEEVAWRRLRVPFGMAMGYAGIVATSTVGGNRGVSQYVMKASEWWGPVRGTVSLGAGGGGSPEDSSLHFAVSGGASLDVHGLLADPLWLGLGARYTSTLAWRAEPGPVLLHGVFGVPEIILGSPASPMFHGTPKRLGFGSFEIDVPVGLWATTPGRGWAYSLAGGIDLVGNLSLDER
jgi:hypothetical protein